ncbi:hypothetical protein C4587_00310, partial [Candidatus Parcubacteria bacterium]
GALRELHAQILGTKSRKRINAIVVVSSLDVYSQIVTIPLVRGGDREQAIELNVRMVSPFEIAQSYAGWQEVGGDVEAGKLEVLSAFAERAVADDLKHILREAGFFAVVLEPRPLALARLLREGILGFDPARPTLALHVDGSGLDFLVLRGGQLYFEYFNPWRDVADEKQQVSMQAFEAAVTRSLHQVLNFYGKHWTEPVAEIFVSAGNLDAAVTKMLDGNFSLSVKPMQSAFGQALGPEWFVAAGSALRGARPRREDQELSLLGITAEDEFRQEQVLRFLRFWTVLLPVGFSILLAALIGMDFFLGRVQASLEAQSRAAGGNREIEELQLLERSAREFNGLVSRLKAVASSITPKNPFLARFGAASGGVRVTKFSLPAPDARAMLAGFASSEDEIKTFRNALEDDPLFQDVDLPITAIKKEPAGFSFSISLSVKLEQD